MIQITDNLAIPEKELDFKATGASGPGGQNVNHVNTAVQLRFSVHDSESLPESVKHRLYQQAGNMINQNGEIIIDARRYRTQQRNRVDAVERLIRLLQKAAVKPKKRKKTRPGKKAKERRLKAKHHRSQKKSHRGPVSDQE